MSVLRALSFFSGHAEAAVSWIVLLVLAAGLAGFAASNGARAPALVTSRATLGVTHVFVARDGSRADVSLRVTARGETLGSLKVTWLVAPVERERPWETPIFVSRPQIAGPVPAGSTVELRWTETDLPLARGSHEISAWVHEAGATGDFHHLVGGSIGRIQVSEPRALRMRLDSSAFAPPAGAASLAAVLVEQPRPLDQTVTTEVAVTNQSQAVVAARVKWLINHYGVRDPWRDPYWQTDWMEVPSLAPGETRPLRWTHYLGLPAGTHGLSIWVHSSQQDTWVHSHASFVIPLEVGANATGVQRAGPAGPLSVAAAAPPSASLILRNHSGADQEITIALQGLPEQRRYDWNLVPPEGVQEGPYRVPASGDRVVDLALPVDCESGPMLARVAVYSSSRSGNAGLQRPVDDVVVEVCR